MKRAVILLALAAAVACHREAPKPAAQTPAGLDDHAERVSLINITHGSTIISRTGESYLGAGADATIDGDPSTLWTNPPRDLPQSIVIGLAARARIERVGVRTPKSNGVNHVQFEGSTDGAAWHPVATVAAATTDAPQWFNVPPAEASFLRVTMVDGRTAPTVRLQSILAAGKELEPARIGPIGGCWSLNGSPAYFEQHGGRVVGVVNLGNQPIYLDGGGIGRVFRFVWLRGNDYGYALMTVSPDGKHLTGEWWHEEAIPLFRGDPWYGERCAAETPHPPLREDVPMALLQRAGRYSVFGGFIPHLSVPMQIVVHEFREATPEANKQRAQHVADALASVLHAPSNVTFVAAGSDSPRQQPVTDAMRVLYSSVDVEVRR